MFIVIFKYSLGEGGGTPACSMTCESNNAKLYDDDKIYGISKFENTA